MNETSKTLQRRFSDHRFFTRYFKGNGIDIGAGSDGLSNYKHFFPLITSIRDWDVKDGDAMLMQGVGDCEYDFINSSHCLEHLKDPYISLKNWLRILKVGGYMLITIPDADLYEQGIWPSNKNSDHKFRFSLNYNYNYVIVQELLKEFRDSIKILKLELVDGGYNYDIRGWDQTLGFLSESAIEIIIQKTKMLYQYECKNCKNIFEEFHSVEERNKPCDKPCPVCGEMQVQIKISEVKTIWKTQRSTL
jgi:putative FmdB family regulatory protein